MALYPSNRSIPTNTDSALVAWAINFDTVFAANPTNYGSDALVAASVTAATTTLSDLFDLAGVTNRLANNPAGYTKPNRADLMTAKAAYLALVRPLAVLIQANDGVSDMDKVTAGITPRNNTRTPIYAPATAPVLAFLNAGIGTHTLGFADEATPSKKLVPNGAIGLELWSAVGATQTPLADLLFNQMSSRWPVTVTWDPAEAGLLATYAARWLGRRGDTGPWSAILTATVVFSEVPTP